MTIHRPSDYVEVYRLKAASDDIREMSGRTGRPDLTDFVNQRILEQVPFHDGQAIVDVGCGDGTLLLAFQGRPGESPGRRSLTGIAPTAEEVQRLRDALTPRSGIRFEQGLATRLPLADACADVVVLNGVLLLLPDERAVRDCLAELARVCKPGGLVYVGEVPDRDEFSDRPYGNSISGWLWWLLRHRGWGAFQLRLRQVVRSAWGREPFVVLPKSLFFATPDRMRELLAECGLPEAAASRHVELGVEGAAQPSPTRWNYLVRKQ